MPSPRRFLGLVLLLGLATGAARPADGQETRDSLAVFFVGNSYVYFNSLPGLLEGISQGLDGPRVVAGSHTHPGFSLRRHLDDGHLPEAFEEGNSGAARWDWIVLQEQSALATVMDTITGRLGDPEEFRGAVRELGSLIQDRGATPVLYMTWAKQRWPDQLEHISDAYHGMGAELGAAVAPVGTAWAAALDARPDLELYVADGSHPSPAGSYLAACVLYATLTGRSPVGAPREVWGQPWNGRGPMESDTPTLLVSLSARDAAFLQGMALRIVGSGDAR